MLHIFFKKQNKNNRLKQFNFEKGYNLILYHVLTKIYFVFLSVIYLKMLKYCILMARYNLLNIQPLDPRNRNYINEP